MPGAGTDKTKNWIETPGPAVVLVEPQLGDNIGSAVRVMANFGLSRLRLVTPREGWPNPRAKVMAAGADRVLENAQLFGSLKDAIADCTYVLVTTARAHDQAKPVVDAPEAARISAGRSFTRIASPCAITAPSAVTPSHRIQRRGSTAHVHAASTTVRKPTDDAMRRCPCS